jgi:flagellar biosynthesis GTPase FlhF
MHLKTFHSPSIQDAIRQARIQLGPDAILLNSKRVSNESDPVVVFAVTFATTTSMRDASVQSPDARMPEADSTQLPLEGDASDTTSDSGSATGVTVSDAASKKTIGQEVAAKAKNSGPGSLRQAPQNTGTLRRPRQQNNVDATVARGTPAGKSGTARVPTVTEEHVTHTCANTDSVCRKGMIAGAGKMDLQSHSELLEQPYPSYEKLFEQMMSMRREMLHLAGSVRRASAATYRQNLASDELRWAYDLLVSQEFSTELTEDIIEDLALRFRSVDQGEQPARKKQRRRRFQGGSVSLAEVQVRDLLRESLQSRIELRPEENLHQSKSKPRIIALVGPPGVGKTTTLVKLAGRLGLHSRFPLQIISMDNYRVAASEQLRTYASVLGVGFDALPSAASLEKALHHYQSKELIFIDTPGYGWRDLPATVDLAALLRGQEHASIHLTLSASMKPADLERMADLYEVFGYHSMLFTKLDETTTIGSLVSAAWTRHKPLSYICAGQRIPDDIQAASHEQLLQRMLPLSVSSEEFAA